LLKFFLSIDFTLLVIGGSARSLCLLGRGNILQMEEPLGVDCDDAVSIRGGQSFIISVIVVLRGGD
jgi:hypothetical protein